MTMPCCQGPTSFLFTVLYIRRMLFAVMFWTFVCFIFSYFNHSQNSSHDNALLLGRELLQEAGDEISATTLRIQKSNARKQNVDSIDAPLPVSESEILKLLLKTSNLPLYFPNEKRPVPATDGRCFQPPSIYDLDYNNIYWQRLKILNTTFYLYNAYYDKRPGVGNLPLVRLIGMIDKVNPPITYCRFWYNNGTSSRNAEIFASSKVSYTYMWYHKWGNFKDNFLQPFIMSCPVPRDMKLPDSVSLIGEECVKVTNNMKIINNNPKTKEDFAVCVKGLDFLFEDISVRLVEWIELLNILGAKKIFFYELEVHPNISKVLSHYVKQGLVELTPLTLPGQQPNLPGFRHLYLKSKLVNKRQNELIPYNDCLYRNLYSYKYLALLDTDEMIMPLAHESWKHLMDEVVNLALEEKNYTRDSYNFRNVYFLDDLQDGKEMIHNAHEEGIPAYLHMLQHVYRSRNYTKPGAFVKCFHNVDKVVSLHNHFPMHCFGQCTTYAVNTSLAHMQHYRKDCVDPLKKSCTEFRNFTTRDTSIWRFKDELIRRTTETLYHLKFFKESKVQ